MIRSRSDENLNAIIASVTLIKRFAIDGPRGFDGDRLAVIERALRQAADDIARERAIERCMGDDWADK
jgi:hypothetical protein